MPIYVYECIYCRFTFEEYRKMNNSGKSKCPRCKKIAFKIPAIFSARIFKKREFADGTSTPDNVRTPSQEKIWKKAQGIVYDKPTITKDQIRRDKQKKSKTIMEEAFKKAHTKVNQGFKGEENANTKRATG